MKRRSILIGLGSIVAGTGTVLGTGAFSETTATRDADVEVIGDASAYLKLAPYDGPNGAYADIQNDGTLSINLDGDDPAGDGPSGGGVNGDALSYFDNVFIIENQGTQEVNVHIEDDEPGGANDVQFYKGDQRGQSLEGIGVDLGVGDSVAVGIFVNTLNNPGRSDLNYDPTPGDKLIDEITIHANAT